MLIGLGILIAGLFLIIGGDSPFVIPNLDKYVKTHVVDDSEKEFVLSLLKDAKTNRKLTSKTNAHFVKELQNLSLSREATNQEFESLGKRMLDFELKSQVSNLSVIHESQKHISSDEWAAIQKDIYASLVKSDKKKVKHVASLNKAFDKWVANINKHVIDEDKRKLAVASVEELRAVNTDNYKKMEVELLNENSAMYKYKASQQELQKLQDEFLQLIKEVYAANTKTHFELVKLTTPEEWKKIQ